MRKFTNTTLNIYKPMEISLRGHLNTDDQARDRTRVSRYISEVKQKITMKALSQFGYYPLVCMFQSNI